MQIKTTLGKALTYTLLGLWSVVCLVPLYWFAVSSLKSVADIDGPPTYLPFVDFVPSLDAWRFILFEPREALVPRFINSAVIGVTSTIVTMLAAGLALYGLTRFRRVPSSGNFGFLSLILATRILPPIVIVLPLYMMARATGTLDTRTFLILSYSTVNLPVALWLLQPVFGSAATDQEEAALLDGASHLTILFTILLPMVRAGLFAAGLLIFLLCWNEYLFAAYLTSEHALTLPPWMVGQISYKEAQVGGEPEEWGRLSAATVVMVVPVLLFAAIAQRALGALEKIRPHRER